MKLCLSFLRGMIPAAYCGNIFGQKEEVYPKSNFYYFEDHNFENASHGKLGKEALHAGPIKDSSHIRAIQETRYTPVHFGYNFLDEMYTPCFSFVKGNNPWKRQHSLNVRME